jgi:WD40 repeat protein
VFSVAFARNGNTLASASLDAKVILWDIRDQTQPRPLGPPLDDHTGPVKGVAFSPDSTTLATGGADSTVILWDVTDPTQPRRLGQP